VIVLIYTEIDKTVDINASAYVVFTKVTVSWTDCLMWL